MERRYGITLKIDYKHSNFKIAYYKESIVSVAIYNTGMLDKPKCIGIAAITGPLHRHGVVGVKLIMHSDVANCNDYIWVEVDNDLARLCEEVGAYHLSTEYLNIVFRKRVNYTVIDEFYYYRKIAGHEEAKMIYGIPSEEALKRITSEKLEDFNIFLDEIPKREPYIDPSKTLESSQKRLPIDIARDVVIAFYCHMFDEHVFEYDDLPKLA